ncbi:MAG: hypothetical protein J0M23_07025 [Rickettsiales bacterium]|nr:hypothetical protein [Rickettsiales bacterium]
MVAVTQNLKRLASLLFGSFLPDIGQVLNILAEFRLQAASEYITCKNSRLSYKIAE